MGTRNKQAEAGRTARFAGMLAAMGTPPRLRIVRLLLSAHPGGMFAGEIQTETGMPGATLSHHLEKLKNHGLVNVAREGTFRRYFADTEALGGLLGFLYAECCTRSRAVNPETLVPLPGPQRKESSWTSKKR